MSNDQWRLQQLLTCPLCLSSKFYGPQNFHPSTTYEDLRSTSPAFSTSPFEENQSLYWVRLSTNILMGLSCSLLTCSANTIVLLLYMSKHPTIYEVTSDAITGIETYTRAPEIFTSPYYRWINGGVDGVMTEEFPPGFRMIAHSDDEGAQLGGELGANMLTECCDYFPDGSEDCVEWSDMRFPTQSCAFLGIAFCKF